MKIINLFLHFYSFLINPLLTLFLASRQSLLYTNLSFIGNLANYRSLFLVWTIFSASYFCLMLYFCFKQFKKNTILIQGLLLTITILLIISNFIPYQNQPVTFFSSLHILLSYFAIGSLSGLIVYLIFSLSYHSQKFYLQMKFAFSIIAFLCMIIFIRYSSVNGLIESIYTIAYGLLINVIRTKLNHNLYPL